MPVRCVGFWSDPSTAGEVDELGKACCLVGRGGRIPSAKGVRVKSPSRVRIPLSPPTHILIARRNGAVNYQLSYRQQERCLTHGGSASLRPLHLWPVSDHLRSRIEHQPDHKYRSLLSPTLVKIELAITRAENANGSERHHQHSTKA